MKKTNLIIFILLMASVVLAVVSLAAIAANIGHQWKTASSSSMTKMMVSLSFHAVLVTLIPLLSVFVLKNKFVSLSAIATGLLMLLAILTISSVLYETPDVKTLEYQKIDLNDLYTALSVLFGAIFGANVLMLVLPKIFKSKA